MGRIGEYPANPDKSYAVGPLDSRFRGNDGYAVEGFHAELRKSYPDSDGRINCK